MDELLEAAMDFSDDDDDDEDNEMDWSSEEDELMKGVYSHFQGEVFPDCKADAVKLMAMLRNLEASPTTMSTRDISRNHIKVTTDAARAVASERAFLLQDAAPVVSGKPVRKGPARFEAGPTQVHGSRKLDRAPKAAAAPQAPQAPRTRPDNILQAARRKAAKAAYIASLSKLTDETFIDVSWKMRRVVAECAYARCPEGG